MYVDHSRATGADVGALPADDQAASRAPEPADVRTYVRTYVRFGPSRKPDLTGPKQSQSGPSRKPDLTGPKQSQSNPRNAPPGFFDCFPLNGCNLRLNGTQRSLNGHSTLAIYDSTAFHYINNLKVKNL